MRCSYCDLAKLLGPWSVGVAILIVMPMTLALGLSVVRVEVSHTGHEWSYVGAEHYTAALSIDTNAELVYDDPWYWHWLGGRPSDPRFYRSLINSLIYTLVAVPLGLAVSLAVACLLVGSFRGVSLIRACVYLPHLLGGVATLLVWSWLLNPQYGWMNQALRQGYHLLDPWVRMIGGEGTNHWLVPDWLYSSFWCKPAVILIHVWTMGGSMLIFLAALRRVPASLIDAAYLDGASRWHRFQNIVIPQITPAILFNVLVSIVFSMQAFTEAYILQNRAQEDGLLFYVLNLYQVAFEPPYRLGYACSLGWILLFVLALLCAPIFWSSRRWVFEAGGEKR